MQSTKLSKVAIFILLFVVTVILAGCGGGGLINNSPTIISFIIDPPSPIEVNQDTTITCYAADPDGDILTYTWTKDGGTISGCDSTITWTAPNTTGTYTITCTVSDSKGGEDIETINIVVTESDETKITNTINGFFQAIIDLDWDMARSYCVYGSEVYVAIFDLEQCCDLYGAYECDIPDNIIVNNINPIIINGDYAEAYVYLTIVWFGEFNSESWYYLQKIGNDWKLYGWMVIEYIYEPS